jgi:type IV pilus assembly protein PilQ
MILLGGLMEKRKSDSGSGTPFLSRLPVIKWFFSSRKHESSDSKLSVLIKPTIIN